MQGENDKWNDKYFCNFQRRDEGEGPIIQFAQEKVRPGFPNPGR
jgi:hypothetical protein